MGWLVLHRQQTEADPLVLRTDEKRFFLQNTLRYLPCQARSTKLSGSFPYCYLLWSHFTRCDHCSLITGELPLNDTQRISYVTCNLHLNSQITHFGNKIFGIPKHSHPLLFQYLSDRFLRKIPQNTTACISFDYNFPTGRLSSSVFSKRTCIWTNILFSTATNGRDSL